MRALIAKELDLVQISRLAPFSACNCAIVLRAARGGAIGLDQKFDRPRASRETGVVAYADKTESQADRRSHQDRQSRADRGALANQGEEILAARRQNGAPYIPKSQRAAAVVRANPEKSNWAIDADLGVDEGSVQEREEGTWCGIFRT